MGSSNPRVRQRPVRLQRLAIPHGEFELAPKYDFEIGRHGLAIPHGEFEPPASVVKNARSRCSRSLMGSSNKSSVEAFQPLDALAIPHGEFEHAIQVDSASPAMSSRSLMGSSNPTSRRAMKASCSSRSLMGSSNLVVGIVGAATSLAIPHGEFERAPPSMAASSSSRSLMGSSNPRPFVRASTGMDLAIPHGEFELGRAVLEVWF